MSKFLAVFLLLCGFLFPKAGSAQVMKNAELLTRGNLAISAAPAVFFTPDGNDIALFVYGLYGLGPNSNVRFRAGFFEGDNYIGGNVEWAMRRGSPQVSLALGGHYTTDLGFDATLNLSYPLSPLFDLYGGFDIDLFLDDDPDLPIYGFLGIAYELMQTVDIVTEFNFGLVEVSPDILSAGFIFYF